MKIRVTNTRCFITEFPPEPWDKKLVKAFTRKSPQSFWAIRNSGGWGGNTQFLSPKKGMFATGLLPMVLEWAKENEEPVILDDERTIPGNQFELILQLTQEYKLRDYQQAAVEAAIQHGRGIIKVPTGGGKSLIAAAIIRGSKVPTLFLVERINLATQTKKRFVEYGIPAKDVGIVGGDFTENNRKVTIATIQSAHKLTNLDKYQCLILDEMHHSKAKSYIALLKKMQGTYYRFGLSGTPFSGDPVEDMYRMTQFGPLIYEMKTQTLIDEGVLSKPTIRMVEITEPDVELVKPYLEQYKQAIAGNEYRNKIIVDFAKGLRGKTLILFRLIEHGNVLRELLPNAMYVDGNTDYMLRDKILDKFNRSTEAVLIASTVIDEGIDFASMEHLINAGGEKSPIKIIQRLGRGLRANGIGDTVNVIDFYDKTCKALRTHSKKRMKLYQGEGHEVKVFRISQ